MDFTDTTVTDGFQRTVTISQQRFTATNFTGLLPIQFQCARMGLLSPMLEVLKTYCHSGDRDHFTAASMFMQRLLGHICGFEDLVDHDLLGQDQGFLAALGAEQCASSSTICRFENSVSREAIDAMNKALFEALLIANKHLRLFPRAGKNTHPTLMLDVDSTHVDLYGNQERKSYNAHYQTSCLAPVLCFLNGWPIAVYNAAGTEDGRKVLEHQLERLIKIIKRAFPHHCILLRGDSGFNSRKIIKTCEKQNICYVIGFSPNKKAQTLVAKQGLVNARRKEKQRYTTKGTAFRTLGELIGYKAASWEYDRRLIARKQHDPKTNQIDLRLIQTNIIKGAKFGAKGYCGQCSSFNPERLYEYLYCGRARDCELQIGMFKTACFGARASSTRFLTNSYRMILAAFCLLILKIMTFLQRKSVANAHAKMRPVHEMSIGKLRVRVICVTSKIKATKGEIQLTLPSVMHEEVTLRALMRIPIP